MDARPVDIAATRGERTAGASGRAGAPASDARAGLGPTVAVAATLALGAAAAFMALVMLVVDPQPVPGIALSERQSAETLVYAVTFVVLLPAAVAGAPRVAAAVARAQGHAALSALAAGMVASLAAVVLLARAADELDLGRSATLLALAAVWLLAAGAALRRSARAVRWRPLVEAGRHAGLAWAAAGAAVAALPLTVAERGSIDLVPLAVGALAVPVVAVVAVRRPLRALRSDVGLAVDAVAIALIALVVVDLVIVTPETATGFDPLYRNSVVQLHDNLLLGPANHVLNGGALLVDSASQYGVGSIYFLAGWFQLLPIGYGTIGLLDGLLTALWFAAGYAILRLAGCSRPLAGAALALGLVVLVLARDYPVGTLVQEGPFRFGMPIAVVLAATWGARRPARARRALAASVAIVALASVWALEQFAVTLGTYCALVALEAALARGDRLRLIGRRAAQVAAACAAAHLLLALAYLAFEGQLPDWGRYFAYLEAFLFGELGDVTYDFTPWAPGLALGAGYVASAAGIAIAVRRGAGLGPGRRPLLVALTGTTAYGVLFLMYLVDRSADHVAAYVALPALLAAALWVQLLLGSLDAPERLRAGALALASWVAVLLIAVAWSPAGERLDHTALAHALPGGDSPRAALTRLRDFPPLAGRVAAAEPVLRERMPGETHSLVMVDPDLRTELLMRAGRGDRLGLTYPLGDGFVPDPWVPGLRDAVDRLRPGELMLIDDGAFASLAAAARDSDDEVIHTFRPGSELTPLQTVALRWITQRFDLRTVHRGAGGYRVVRLEPRR